MIDSSIWAEFTLYTKGDFVAQILEEGGIKK